MDYLKHVLNRNVTELAVREVCSENGQVRIATLVAVARPND